MAYFPFSIMGIEMARRHTRLNPGLNMASRACLDGHLGHFVHLRGFDGLSPGVGGKGYSVFSTSYRLQVWNQINGFERGASSSVDNDIIIIIIGTIILSPDR